MSLFTRFSEHAKVQVRPDPPGGDAKQAKGQSGSHFPEGIRGGVTGKVERERNARHPALWPGVCRASLKRSTRPRTPGYFDGRPDPCIRGGSNRKGPSASLPRPRDLTGNVQLYLPDADRGPVRMSGPLVGFGQQVKLEAPLEKFCVSNGYKPLGVLLHASFGGPGEAPPNAAVIRITLFGKLIGKRIITNLKLQATQASSGEAYRP